MVKWILSHIFSHATLYSKMKLKPCADKWTDLSNPGGFGGEMLTVQSSSHVLKPYMNLLLSLIVNTSMRIYISGIDISTIYLLWEVSLPPLVLDSTYIRSLHLKYQVQSNVTTLHTF